MYEQVMTFITLITFRIKRLGDTTVCHYKMWSTSEEWLPKTKEDELQIFFKDSDGKYILPEGVPDYVEEDWQRKHDIPEIKKAIESQKLQLKYEQYAWWNDFLNDPASYNESTAQDSVWFLDVFKQQEPIDAPETSKTRRVTPLTLLLEKQNRCPVVYTGKKRKVSNKRPQPQQTTKPDQTFDLCIGFMIAFKAKTSQNKILIGKIVSVTENLITVSMYEGKLNGVVKATVLPNGQCRKINISRERLVYVFELTKSSRIPALAVRKIQDAKTA